MFDHYIIITHMKPNTNFLIKIGLCLYLHKSVLLAGISCRHHLQMHLFCSVVLKLDVRFILAATLLEKGYLVALFKLCGGWHCSLSLFLVVPRVGLQSVIAAFPSYTKFLCINVEHF